MGYVIPNGFSRVVFEYQGVSPTGSKPCWGFGVDIAPSDTFLAELNAWWEDELQDVTNAGATLERIVMRNDTFVKEFPVAQVGQQEGDFQPPQVCVLVSMASGQIGRANRGRMYWPFVIKDADVDGGGSIVPASRDTYSALLASLSDVVAAGDASFVILHAGSSDPTPVSSVSVQGVVATQRRRVRR